MTIENLLGSGPGPFWTEKLYRPASGQDHLGLGSVSSDRILASLSPGINVLTVHPRYLSFYAFVLDEFWQRPLPRTRRSFAAFYRPCEAMYAVAVHLCDRTEHDRHGPMRAVVGTETVRPLTATHPAEYDPTIDYMKSDLGGYGLYYATTMASLGLVVPALTGQVPFDWPTPTGQEVAAAFRNAVQRTPYFREYFGHPERKIPAKVLSGYAQAACLCQLQLPAAPDRALLVDIMCHGGGADESLRRRATLRFFLDVGSATNGLEVTQDTFRRLIYFRDLGDDVTYIPKPAIRSVARRWRLYQAREYYSFALNRLWALLCGWGLQRSAAGAHAVPLQDWWNWVDAALDFGSMARQLAIPNPRLDASATLPQLAQWLSQVAVPTAGVDEVWPSDRSPNENVLYAWCSNSVVDSETIPAMLSLLVLVWLRIGSVQRQSDLSGEADILTAGGTERLAMSRFFERVRRATMSSQTLGQFTRQLLLDFVIRQHERVATGKIPDDTFRFRRDGDRLRFSTLPALVGFNDSRFLALTTTTAELGLGGGLGSADHRMTPDGRELLRSGDLSTVGRVPR